MKRIIFTGGSGKAGRFAIQHFLDHGYQVLNLDRAPLNNPETCNLSELLKTLEKTAADLFVDVPLKKDALP